MLKKILLTAAMVLLAGTAAAADPQQITQGDIIAAAQSASDPSLSALGILKQIFGDIINNPLSPTESGAGDTALSQIFGVLNMSLLALGAILVSYNITAGVVQTAQDGEFLGKRFSTAWIPIRMTIGLSALVPVFKGWGAAQLFILWLGVIGAGIANLATTAIASWIDHGGAMVSQPITVADSNFIEGLYRINLCRSAADQQYGAGTIKEQIVGDRIDFGNGDSFCGSIQLPGNGSLAGSASSAGTAAELAARKTFFDIDKAIHSHTDALIAALVPFNDGLPTHPQWARDADIEGFARQYQDSLRINLRGALHTNTQLRHELATTGFIGLGNYFAKLSGARDYQNQLLQTQPAILQPAPLPDGFPIGTYAVAGKWLTGYEQQTQTDIKALGLAPSDEGFLIRQFNKRLNQTLPAPGTSCNNNQADSGRLSMNILGRAIDASGCETNALNRMKSVGDWISVIGWAGISIAAGIKGALAGAVAGAQTVPVLGAAPAAAAAAVKASVEQFLDIFVPLMLISTFFGTMLSVYLPLVPYVVWLGAIFSWVVVVIEGVVAAPLWAFAHLDTDGEGMGQKAAHGYGFLFQILFRPILMVVGFVMMVIVLDVMGGIFFKTFVLAVSEAQADSFNGLVALIAEVGIFFLVSVMIVNLSANLVHVVPDTVLSWISPSTQSAGAGRDMTSHFGAASAGFTGAGSKLIGDAIDRARGRSGGRGKSRGRSGGPGGSGGGSAPTSGSPAAPAPAAAINPGMEWHRKNNTSSINN